MQPNDVDALNNKGNALAKLVEQTTTNNIKPADYHYSQSLFVFQS
jgi:hypothetical protein